MKRPRRPIVQAGAPATTPTTASSPEPGFACLEDGLGAIDDFELGEDVGDVVAYGLVREAESVGDLGGARSGGEGVEYLALACGEVGERVVRRGPGHERRELTGDRGADDGAAG